MEFRGYKDLECYKKARELRIFVAVLVKKFPPIENFLLRSQITDSSRSVSSNIVEGYGRFTYSDTRNFFIIARGSNLETMEHIQIAFDEGYINENELETGSQLCEHVFRLINGYINYLNKQKNNKSD